MIVYVTLTTAPEEPTNLGRTILSVLSNKPACSFHHPKTSALSATPQEIIFSPAPLFAPFRG